MKSSEIINVLALSKIPGIGAGKARALITYCGGPSEVFKTKKERILKIPGIGATNYAAIKKNAFLKEAEEELELCDKRGVEIIEFRSDKYPKLLRGIFDSPLVLYKKGNLEFNKNPTIAIVGTRKPTEEGLEIANKFATHFSKNGINVVSGLAFGIDSEAHKASLKSNGVTTAVLGHGLATIYPKENTSLASKIVQKGALLTEYGWKAKAEAGNFPSRNRIISGMCRAVLVVEAKKKGGALITGKFGFEQNREVYAIPGGINKSEAEGCNHLIRDNFAKLVTCPEEIMADLDLKILEEAKGVQMNLFNELPPNLDPIESKILNELGRGEMLVDQLSDSTNIPTSSLLSLLLGLEFKGLVRQFPGRKFRRI